jgi:lysozyme
MKTSKRGIDLICQFEGFRAKAYPDPGTGGEPWTVGFGHTSAAGPPIVRKGMSITKDEAKAILARDITTFEVAVMSLLKRPPTQNQFDAMVSFCYNVGPGNFAKSSVLSHFNAGGIVAAANVFQRWNKAGGKVLPGLVKRRKAESDLFLTA